MDFTGEFKISANRLLRKKTIEVEDDAQMLRIKLLSGGPPDNQPVMQQRKSSQMRHSEQVSQEYKIPRESAVLSNLRKSLSKEYYPIMITSSGHKRGKRSRVPTAEVKTESST